VWRVLPSKWFAENQDEQGSARLFTNLGILHHRLDEHTKGVEYYMKAAEIFERMGDKGALAQTCVNLANVLSMLIDSNDRMNCTRTPRNCSMNWGGPTCLRQASYNRAYLLYLRGCGTAMQLHSFSRLRPPF